MVRTVEVRVFFSAEQAISTENTTTENLIMSKLTSGLVMYGEAWNLKELGELIIKYSMMGYSMNFVCCSDIVNLAYTRDSEVAKKFLS